MRHYNTDNELLRFSTNNNAEVKGLSLSPLIGCGVATPRQFLFSPQKSDITMQSQNQSSEQWLPVVGYEGYYEVSTLGRVKSIERVYLKGSNWGGIQTHKVKPIIKKTRIGFNGYYTVALVVNDKTSNKLLHRVIAMAHIPNIDPCILKVVNHKNGIKTDNRIENLEWVSSSYNNTHALLNQLRKPAKTNLTKELVSQMESLVTVHKSKAHIAKIIGLKPWQVQKYFRGKDYKYQGFNDANQVNSN